MKLLEEIIQKRLNETLVSDLVLGLNSAVKVDHLKHKLYQAKSDFVLPDSKLKIEKGDYFINYPGALYHGKSPNYCPKKCVKVKQTPANLKAINKNSSPVSKQKSVG